MPFHSLPSWVPARTGDIRSRRAGSDSEAEPDRRPSSANRTCGSSAAASSAGGPSSSSCFRCLSSPAPGPSSTSPSVRFFHEFFKNSPSLIFLGVMIICLFVLQRVRNLDTMGRKWNLFDGYNKNLGINFTDKGDDSLDDLVLDPFDDKETEMHKITKALMRDKLQKPNLPEANKEMAYQQTNNAALFNQKDNKHWRPSGQNSHKTNHRDHHRTDARVRQCKDQLAIAKVYLEVEPTKSRAQFSRELQQQEEGLSDQ